MRELVKALVFAAIDELNATMTDKAPLAKDEQAILHGDGSALDSLDVANLLMLIEDQVQTALGVEIDLLDSELMSQAVNPYRTVATTIDTAAQALAAQGVTEE